MNHGFIVKIMKKLMMILSTLFIKALALAASSNPPSMHSNNILLRNEIKSCFDSWTKCWNSGDVDGYLNGYIQSSSARYVSGKNIIRGYDEICKHFHSRGAKGKLLLKNFESNVISDCHAVCFGEYQLDLLDGGGEQYEGCFTCHLQKVDIGDSKGWKIVSDHSS